MRIALKLCLLVLFFTTSACSDSRSRSESTDAKTNDVKEAKPESDTAKRTEEEPKPAQPAVRSNGFQSEGRARAYRRGFSRELKVLYLEQRFRWQARALNEALKWDKGLAYQGFFFDAQAGWMQPTSQWSNEVMRQVRPLAAPFSANGEEVETEKAFLELGYDVILLGDLSVEGRFTVEQFGWLLEFVRQGGGLILMPGQGHHCSDYAEIEAYRELSPLTFETGKDVSPDASKLKYWGVTESGFQHELFWLGDDAARLNELWGGEVKGEFRPGQLHGLYWYHPTGPAKEEATVLARIAKEGEAVGSAQPLIATQELGKGRVLWVGTDDTHYWRQFIGDYYFYTFWKNAIRWAANDPGKPDDD